MSNNQPTHKNHFDVIIIGSGPGGEGAAMGLTKAGFKVAIIERENSVGGGCTHWGTIPSKSLRHAVSRIIEFNQNPLYCNDTSTLHRTFSQILHHAAEVVSKQTRMRQGFYDRNHCQIIHGEAKFVDHHTVSVPAMMAVLSVSVPSVLSLPQVHAHTNQQKLILIIAVFMTVIQFYN